MAKLKGVPWGPLVLVLASLALAYFTYQVATEDEPNKLAAAMLQVISIALGLTGSFVFGRDQSRQAAAEIIKPHAKSAFRRTRNLYLGLGRQREAIAYQGQQLRDLSTGAPGSEKVSLAAALGSLAALDLVAVEQISTADDAMEDWRDLVPDEVAAIEAEAREREERENP